MATSIESHNRQADSTRVTGYPQARGVVRRACRDAAGVLIRSTSSMRMLPDYLIIGAKRAGTTSLQHYLTSHPAVVSPHCAKGSHYFDVNFTKGWSWFRAHFPTTAYQAAMRLRGVKVVAGEASPYYVFHPLALPRIHEALPAVKLVLVLRDPVARALSHHRSEVVRGFEEEPAHRAFELEDRRLAGEAERMTADPTYQSFHYRHHSYLARGLYADQLATIRRLFPAEQLLVVSSEDLSADPGAQLDVVFDFLGLPPHRPGRFERFKATPPMATDPGVQRFLAEYYAEPNRRLYEALGRDFGWVRP